MNVVPTGAKNVKSMGITQATRAISSRSKKIRTSVFSAKTKFLRNKESVVNASKNCQRNVRNNLIVGIIATVLQMPSSARLVLRVERRLKRRANKTKTTSPKIKITAAYVKVTAQRHHV